MVTVDEFNRPRIRTVRAFRLKRPTTARERFTVFILTRTSTRKIDQIAKNPLVTLYFNEDQRAAYATIMGRATVHRDPQNPRLQPFLDSATVKFFWPTFPRDFVMIEVTPDWLEFIGPGALERSGHVASAGSRIRVARHVFPASFAEVFSTQPTHARSPAGPIGLTYWLTHYDIDGDRKLRHFTPHEELDAWKATSVLPRRSVHLQESRRAAGEDGEARAAVSGLAHTASCKGSVCSGSCR